MTTATIQIDSAGRVVLPKPIRDRFKLEAGDKLRLSADDSGIRLEPAEISGSLVRKGKGLVFRGEFREAITTDLIEKMIHWRRK